MNKKSTNKQTVMQFKIIAEVFSFCILQSIPQGLIYGSIPILFQLFQKQFVNTDYMTCISIFYCSSLPFNLKLIWSPLVDYCIGLYGLLF